MLSPMMWSKSRNGMTVQNAASDARKTSSSQQSVLVPGRSAVARGYARVSQNERPSVAVDFDRLESIDHLGTPRDPVRNRLESARQRVVPELSAHLRANRTQYALALAAEGSGVVTYAHVHANRFISELASSRRAGFIVTLDYGDTTWRLLQGARRGDFPFRVYGSGRSTCRGPTIPTPRPAARI